MNEDRDREIVKKLSKLFRKGADILDEIIALDEQGETDSERAEQLLGQFALTVIQLESLK